MGTVTIVRPNRQLLVWRRQGAGEAAWGSTPENYRGSVLRAGGGVLSLDGATRVRAQVYCQADASLTYEVAGLHKPGSGDPIGQLVACGTITFDTANTLTGHPITGAAEVWRPGCGITDDSGLNLAEIECNQDTSRGIAAWLVLSRIEDFDALTFHVYGTLTGDALAVASVR